MGGVRYYIEALDLDRLYANLVATSEEATQLRLHAARHPTEPQWLVKADAADTLEAELRELIKIRRAANGSN